MRTQSIWLDGALRDEPAHPPLVDSVDADVAIVGGGVTGLATACAMCLRFPQWRVVLLEGDRIGSGATGRSTGALTPLPERRWGAKVARDGEEEARRAGAFQAAGVRAAVDLVREGDIDCGLSSPGYLLLGEGRHERLLQREADAMTRVGTEGRYLDAGELRSRLRQDFWHAAVESPSRWVDPARYARGLARLAERRGARLFEGSRVVEVAGGSSGTWLRLAGGAGVHTACAVLATDAYSGKLGFLRRRQYVLHTFAIATEPLSEEHRASLGWAGREILFEAPRTGHTLLLTPDGRVLCRGLARYRFGDNVRTPDLRAAASSLKRAIDERFPQLGGVRPSHCWSGPLAMTRSLHPAVGELPGPPRVLYATGYSGHGLAYGTLAGRLLTERLAGERSSELEYAQRFSRPPFMPPEPLRWLGVTAGAAWMRWRRL